MDAKMKNIKKWLTASGFSFRESEFTDGRPVVIVDTDYTGLYAGKDVFNKHSQIVNHCMKCRGLQTEARGNYTALFITIKEA